MTREAQTFWLVSSAWLAIVAVTLFIFITVREFDKRDHDLAEVFRDLCRTTQDLERRVIGVEKQECPPLPQLEDFSRPER